MKYIPKNDKFHFTKESANTPTEEVDTQMEKWDDTRWKGGLFGLGLLVFVIIILKLVMLFTDIK
jgi:hypothetical protein